MVHLPNLNRDLMTGALRYAEHYGAQGDPFASFFFAWYSFNHFYDAFAEHNHPTDAYRRNNSGSVLEKERLRFLSNQPEFQTIYRIFQNTFVGSHQPEVGIPVHNMKYIDGDSPPEQRRVRLFNLSSWELFKNLYTIRNNLFHGQKRVCDENDRCVCDAGARILIPLLHHLLAYTEDTISG